MPVRKQEVYRNRGRADDTNVINRRHGLYNFGAYSIKDSNSIGRLILAVVSNVRSQTIAGFHLAAKEPNEVAIAALLYALCQKDYPTRYGLSALWSFGNSPQFLLVDGSKEFYQPSTDFSDTLKTNNIKLLKRRENSYVSKTYTERLFQSINSHL
jgi:hypothetical protein